MKYIQLHTKEQFKEVMKQYNSNWKADMWNFCKEETCYIPEGDYFITLDKAREMGMFKLI